MTDRGTTVDLARNGTPMRIVVATDGSRGSDAALKFAARLAADGKAELTVVTVVHGNGSLPGARAKGNSSPSAKILDDAGRMLAARGITAALRPVDARQTGAVPEAIAREAEKLKADLVVIGSEGRDTLSEWVLGGVALRLIYLSRRPVTVVRPPRKRTAT